MDVHTLEGHKKCKACNPEGRRVSTPQTSVGRSRLFGSEGVPLSKLQRTAGLAGRGSWPSRKDKLLLYLSKPTVGINHLIKRLAEDTRLCW